MSKWNEITDPDDVSLSDDGTEVHIWYGYDDDGNCYVSISAKMIFNLFTEEQLSAIVAEIEAGRALKEKK